MNNANSPAMPQTGTLGAENEPSDCADWGGVGLTKREHFAAMAMQGFIAAGVNGMPGRHDLAMLSVEYAGALLAELDKE